MVLVPIVAVACLAVWLSTRPDDSGRVDTFAVGAVAGALAPTTTTTAAPTTTTTAVMKLAALPLPALLPPDAYAPTPQVVLGSMEIPKLGVTGEIQEGITLTAINRGPGHWPGTPMPGGFGNAVFAGHRTTWSKPFARLDELAAGDKVNFTTPDGSFTYEVRGIIVVPAANIGIAQQSAAHTATLFACHPRGQATHRIVAKLRLLRPDGTPVDPEWALPPIDQGSDPTTGTTLVVGTGTEVTTAVVDPLAKSSG